MIFLLWNYDVLLEFKVKEHFQIQAIDELDYLKDQYAI